MNLIPRAEHPRPDFTRENWLNLNGVWDFDFSNEELCPLLHQKITVPFTWTSPLSGVEKDEKGTGWYRRAVRFDAQDETWLVIGAADYETKVYVNGQFAGGHVGGYGEIRLNVSALWHKGEENDLAIRVTDMDEDTQTRGKQGYGEIRGIWQTVYLEDVPATHLDFFKIETKCDGTVTLKAEILSEYAHETQLAASFDGKTYSMPLTLQKGENQAELSFALDKPHLWTCEDPYLYEGTLSVDGDCVSTYFGVREIGYANFDGRKYPWITLNGEPVYLNGTLDQSFNPKGYFTLPDEADVKEEIERLKALGLNMVRLHIKPEEPRKLYWMDKLGMLGFADMVCFWGEPKQSAMRQYENELTEMLRRDCNHPSIIAWIVFNETWGLFSTLEGAKNQRQYLPATQEWVRSVYHSVKAFDSTRLCEDNSACNGDHVESDLNTWHFYINGYMSVKEHIDYVAKFACEGSGWNYINDNKQGNIPLMNSECGMVWGVQDSAGDSDLAWQYHYMLNEYRLHENICGFVFTEFHDVINEFNGYYRIDNQKKYFGYDLLGMGMDIRDLHAKDFIAYDAPPCQTLGGGEQAVIPIYYSNFGGAKKGEKLTLDWFLHGSYGYYAQGSREIVSNGSGLTALEPICVTMPKAADVAVLTFRLCKGDQILSKNFTTFDVRGESIGVVSVKPNSYKEKHFANDWAALSGHKVCGVGEGSFLYEIPTQGFMEFDKVEIRFEASAKVLLAKDSNGNMPSNEGADFMHGYKMDPGTNHNSYFMTDEKRFPSELTLLVEGESVLSQTLPDDPADCNGVLSWHYQTRERYLDEAGSYGYLIKAVVQGDLLKKAKEKGTMRVELRCNQGGLALYGRNSGRFPIDIEIIPRV